MKIADIWVSQKSLKRYKQIPELVEIIKSGNYHEIPAIELICNDHDEVQLLDGHHRLAAYYLAGWRTLEYSDFHITTAETGFQLRKFGKIDKLVKHYNFSLFGLDKT